MENLWVQRRNGGNGGKDGVINPKSLKGVRWKVGSRGDPSRKGEGRGGSVE